MDGDTEFCNSAFSYSGDITVESGPTLTAEQMMAASSQNDADYHLAMRLANGDDWTSNKVDEQEGQIMAAATEASLREYNGLPSSTISTGLPDDIHVEVGVPIQRPPGNAAYASPTVAFVPLLNSQAKQTISPYTISQEETDRMLAMQLSQENTSPPGPDGSGNGGDFNEASLELARKLQREEKERAAHAQPSEVPTRPTPRNNTVQTGSNCSIM